MYFNEGGSHRLVGPFEGCAAARVLACPAAKKRPHVQATRPAKQQHRAEVHEKGSKKSSEPSLEKARRAMCTVEDKTGIPLPGYAIGSLGARWA